MVGDRREASGRLHVATALSLVALMLLAGCLQAGGSGSPFGPDRAGFADGGVYLEGVVVDEEHYPIAGVEVLALPIRLSAQTDEAGAFTLGPVAPGSYDIVAKRQGYTEASTGVRVVDGAAPPPLLLTLAPVDPTLPYRETWLHVTYVNCWSANLIGNVPCTKLADYAAGTDLSPDETFAFIFQVPAAGMVDMLVETDWETQSLGRDMVFQILTPPNQPLNALIERYFAVSGGPVLRGWVVADEVNPGGNEPFDAEPHKVSYEARIIPANSNQTVPFHGLYLNHRTESYMTYFFNRAGPRDFTAAPDR